MRKIVFLLCCTAIAWNVQSQTKTPLKPADIYRLQNIGNAAIAPDGNWVVYSLSTVDKRKKDKQDDNIWMISWDGKQNIQLTFSKNQNHHRPLVPMENTFPLFRPGQMAAKTKTIKTRTSPRFGCSTAVEGKKVTNVKGDIDSYIWSPDGKKAAADHERPGFFRYRRLGSAQTFRDGPLPL